MGDLGGLERGRIGASWRILNGFPADSSDFQRVPKTLSINYVDSTQPTFPPCRIFVQTKFSKFAWSVDFGQKPTSLIRVYVVYRQV